MMDPPRLLKCRCCAFPSWESLSTSRTRTSTTLFAVSSTSASSYLPLLKSSWRGSYESQGHRMERERTEERGGGRGSARERARRVASWEGGGRGEGEEESEERWREARCVDHREIVETWEAEADIGEEKERIRDISFYGGKMESVATKRSLRSERSSTF